MQGFEDRITCDPAIRSGKPFLKGRQIPVYIILELFSAGETSEAF
jgi:uncharacterized protein (DUF433 family)